MYVEYEDNLKVQLFVIVLNGSKPSPFWVKSDFQDQIKDFIKSTDIKFSTLFNEGSQEALLTAGDEVRKLKFMLKLSQEAVALEEDIFDY